MNVAVGFAGAAAVLLLLLLLLLLLRALWVRRQDRQQESERRQLRRIGAKYVEHDRREKEWDQGKRGH